MRESSATLISYFESTDFLNGNFISAIYQMIKFKPYFFFSYMSYVINNQILGSRVNYIG